MENLEILSRNEMRKITGGYISGCTETNCIACDSGNECKSYDASLPGENCSWGICEECC